MPEIGQTIAHYRILEKLGQGAMGEVYLAQDTSLDRKVAVKFLPDIFSSDPERSARFTREAKLLASLNHPNIATVHGLERAEGSCFIAMELVEGETLAQVIERGPLPLNEALDVGRQIAEGLEAAHEKGVLHRDLKPSNIKITPEGKVKILDFGLAKVLQDESSDMDASQSPTLTIQMTRSGAILGTAAYMSPEQARGHPVDQRSDIWAFGAVLYELITGSPAFGGDSMSDILSAVLRTEPDLNHIPWRARRLLARCLTKDRRLRLQAIGEARIMIDHPEEEVSGRATRSPMKLLMASIIVLAGIASWALLRKTPREPRMVSTWSETLPQTFVEDGGLAISGDGRRLAYVVTDGGSESIWLRELDQPGGHPIPGTEGGRRPFFSPDGNWIAYWTPSVLKKIPVTGGSAIPLCPGAGFYGGSWGQDNRIVASRNDGLVVVPAGGGTCKTLTTADPQKGEGHRFPQILPGGEAILYTEGIQGEYDRARIAIFDLNSGGHRVLENTGSSPRYVATGHLVYVRGGTMFAAPFDLKRLAVTGAEVAVIEDIYFRATGGLASYAVSDSGLLLFSTGRSGRTLSALEWRDRQGVAQPLPLPVQGYTVIRLSPNGQRAVAGIRRGDATQDLWNIGLERGDFIKLTAGAANLAPEWTPNGRRVVFLSGLNRRIYWTAADGSSKPDLLLEETWNGQEIPVSWVPDGSTLLLKEGFPSRIWVVNISASGDKPHPLLEATSANLADARVSPDGKWVAYTSDESGTNQVYVGAFPTPAGKTPVSADGGQEPRWSSDTRELFYRNPLKNQLMVTEVQTGSIFRAGRPKPLFELSTSNWDVAPDAKRFLVANPQEATVAAPQLRVVVNWFDELPRKVPAGKR